MKRKLKVLVVFDTRPEVIKVAPVLKNASGGFMAARVRERNIFQRKKLPGLRNSSSIFICMFKVNRVRFGAR